MTAPLTRRPTLLIALVALLTAVVVPGAQPALANGGTESEFVAKINAERGAAGLPALQVAGDLTSVARRHSTRMADADNLHHNPNLSGAVSGWQKVGENVGRGPSVGPIHQAFMNSPGHRRNILDGDFTQVGVGVVVRDGQVWVTEVFRRPAGTSAPEPEPEPAASSEASGGSSGGSSSGGSSGGSSGSAAPEPAPEPEPEPEPTPPGPRHEIVEPPLGLDRGLLTLARLEGAEQGVPLSSALE